VTFSVLFHVNLIGVDVREDIGIGNTGSRKVNLFLRLQMSKEVNIHNYKTRTETHGQADMFACLSLVDSAAATRLPAEPVEPKLRVELLVESRDSMEPAPVGPFRLLKAAVRPTGLRLTPMTTSSR